MFENSLQKGMFERPEDKTFIDKLLGKEDIDHIRELVKKREWDRKDMLEILYLLSSKECKLWNLSSWSHYVLMKFFVWIRDFVAHCENFYDYVEDMEQLERQGKTTITPRMLKEINNIKRLMEHNVKFLIDLYFNIGRTSLSVGATGFLELLKNKFEVDYKGQQQGVHIPNEKTGMRLR